MISEELRCLLSLEAGKMGNKVLGCDVEGELRWTLNKLVALGLVRYAFDEALETHCFSITPNGRFLVERILSLAGKLAEKLALISELLPEDQL